jgi:proteasome lid subunit RPN8/RPN11
MGELNQTLQLRQSDYQQMIQHVMRALPEEACGIVGGIRNTSKVVFDVENSLHSPVRFLMEANGQVRALIDIENSGLELLAIYHSHPTGPATPSPTDLSEFLYPGTYYLICILKLASGYVRLTRCSQR